MKAILIGATGLVGSEILKRLINDDRFTSVNIFTRRALKITHPKIKELIIDFENLETLQEPIVGDVLFSALGTTLKKAGSKEAQYKVDFQYQYDIARLAQKNHVGTLIQISSVGANPRSPFFYLRMKGELEESLKGLDFKKCCILQPGPLVGQREEERPQEKWFIALLEWFPKIPGMESYWPIQAKDVAIIAINEVFSPQQGFYQLKPKSLFAKI